jgi:hypothetical protein
MSTDYRALCAELLQPLAEYDGANPYHEHRALITRARAALAKPEPVAATAEQQARDLLERMGIADAQSFSAGDLIELANLIARAPRAQPDPAEPADEGIPQWSEGVCGDGAAILRDGLMIPIEELVASLNRAERLARWGRPTIKSVPPTNEELDAWWEKCAELTREGKADCYWAFGDVTADYVYSIARAAIARWGRPAIEPVPVSKRLPGPEDCDAEGRCWWWHPAHIEDDFDNDWVLLNFEWADGRRDSDDSLIYTHWLPHHALPTPEATNG